MRYLALSDFFESQLAIIIYIVILFTIMILVVVFLYFKEKRNVKLFNSIKKMQNEENVEKMTEKVTNHIDQKQ